ncbi:MAG: nucleoside-diphosphate sugar epimerase/dehydratase [Gammaproteobacteria bacterium]
MGTTTEGWLLLRNRWIVFIHDLLWIPLAILLAYWVRFNLGTVPSPILDRTLLVILAALPMHAVTFWLFGCYRGIWRYASVPDLMRILKAVCLGALATAILVFMLERLQDVPRSVLLIYPIFLVFGLSGSRLLYRGFKDQWLSRENSTGGRALIVGAGRAGELLIRDLKRNGSFVPVVLVDDDPRKQGYDVHGVRVRGYLNDLRKLIHLYEVKIVLVAIPSASREAMGKVVQVCNEEKVECRTLPSLSELADGSVEISRLRPVTVEDLLSREPVILDVHGISDFVAGKCILVTGGGGSIGSELCRQLISRPLDKLVVLDNGEFNLYQLQQQLRGLPNYHRTRLILGDVQDDTTVEEVFKLHRPQMVFHAAAYKHVPMVEMNALEGMRNNVIGTKVVADAAVRAGSECFVLISTDKTVNPTSVMGASKRVAELYCHGLSQHSSTHLLTTRFGNVLGSNGSVIPFFERQIAEGGPVTITHPEVTRYFMTLSEAAGLIVQAGTIGRDGEIFILDMGQPVRILDLAKQMIRLSGLEPERDIKIVYTGLRPGEKLHEDLFYTWETRHPTAHPKIFLADHRSVDWATFSVELVRLERALKARDMNAAMDLLRLIVPEYKPGEYLVEENGIPATPAAAVPNLRIIK